MAGAKRSAVAGRPSLALVLAQEAASAAPPADTATHRQALRTTPRERLAHNVVAVEPRELDDKGEVTSYGVRVLDNCPLDAYLRRGLVDWRQHDAGTWLARTFRKAVHTPAMTASYGERLGGGGGGDSGLDGRRSLYRALLGAGLAEVREEDDAPRGAVILNRRGCVAVAVCGMEEWAGGSRRLALLREALDALADHLKIGTKMHEPAPSAERDAEEAHREAIVSRTIVLDPLTRET